MSSSEQKDGFDRAIDFLMAVIERMHIDIDAGRVIQGVEDAQLSDQMSKLDKIEALMQVVQANIIELNTPLQMLLPKWSWHSADNDKAFRSLINVTNDGTRVNNITLFEYQFTEHYKGARIEQRFIESQTKFKAWPWPDKSKVTEADKLAYILALQAWLAVPPLLGEAERIALANYLLKEENHPLKFQRDRCRYSNKTESMAIVQGLLTNNLSSEFDNQINYRKQYLPKYVPAFLSIFVRGTSAEAYKHPEAAIKKKQESVKNASEHGKDDDLPQYR